MKKHLLIIAIIFCTMSIVAQDSTSFRTLAGQNHMRSYVKLDASQALRDSLNATNNWTLECMVKPTVTGSGGTEMHFIESYGTGGGGFVLRITQGKLKAYVFSATGDQSVTGSTSLEMFMWSHVAASYDASTKIIRLYINGVQDGTGLATITPVSFANQRIYAGARGDDAAVPFNIDLDEVRIWNTRRTTEEIAANMNKCLSGSETGIQVYYDFENITGLGILDKSGNGNTGIIINKDDNSLQAGPFTCQASGASTDDKWVSTSIEVYPNPVSHTLHIDTDITFDHFQICDLNGKVLSNGKNESNQINVIELENGLYFLTLTGNNKIARKSFVVSR